MFSRRTVAGTSSSHFLCVAPARARQSGQRVRSPPPFSHRKRHDRIRRLATARRRGKRSGRAPDRHRKRAVARERTAPLRVVRTARKPCIAPRPGSNVSLAGVPRRVSKLHRPWPGGGRPVRANSSLCHSDSETTSAGAATPALTVWTRPTDRAPSYGPCGQAMEKLTLPHRLPTLAALAPTPSPLLQQRFIKKETPPQPDRARIAPSSQELRHRNNPVKSPGGSTRECEKQHVGIGLLHQTAEAFAKACDAFEVLGPKKGPANEPCSVTEADRKHFLDLVERTLGGAPDGWRHRQLARNGASQARARDPVRLLREERPSCFAQDISRRNRDEGGSGEGGSSTAPPRCVDSTRRKREPRCHPESRVRKGRAARGVRGGPLAALACFGDAGLART